MRFLRSLAAGLRGLFRKEQVEREMDEELRAYVEASAQEKMRAGLSREEALRAARIEFGSVESVKEDVRHAGWERVFEEVWHDARYGFRTLWNNPGFLLAGVVTLALGIGVNTAAFTVFNLQLRPFPVKDPESVVLIRARWPGFSFPQYVYLRNHSRVFSQVLASADEKVLLGNTSAEEGLEEVPAVFVSDDYFAALGGKPLVGRFFVTGENGAGEHGAEVVLNHYYWQRRFAGDPNIVGKTLLIDGKPFVVIGITEATFVGLKRDMPAVWLPLMMRAELPTVYDRTYSREDTFANAGFGWLRLAARLRPGATREEAHAETSVLLSQVTPKGPEPERANPFQIEPLSGLAVGDLWMAMLLVLSATGIVLLIACSNLANLLLARAAVRQKEIGLRLCLGASRGRVVRQLLTESLLLAGLGGGAGVLLAWWCVEFWRSSLLTRYGAPPPDSLALELAPDANVLVFTLVLSILGCVAFGLVPALRATRTDLIRSIKDEGATFGRTISRSRLRSGLVAAQVALCLLLLIPAGLVLRGLVVMLGGDPGFETKGVLYLGYSLELSGYDDTRARLFHRQLVDRLRAMPGIERISLGSAPSSNALRVSAVLQSASGEAESHPGLCAGIEDTFLETMRIPIVRGRGFAADEVRPVPQVTIVSESAARNLWPGEEPIGKVLKIQRGEQALFPPLTVVGVAGDAQNGDRGHVPPVYLYVPRPQSTWTDVGMLVRTAGSAAEYKAQVQTIVRTMEPTARLWVRTVVEDIANSEPVIKTRAVGDFALALGLLGVALAAVGLYGVIAYSVSQRTREFGIRMALGATGGDVLRLVVGQGLRMVAVGATVGIAGGAAVARVLSTFLFGLNPLDPVAYLVVSAFLLLVILLAMYLPAHRAARADPMAALRYE